MKLIKGRMMMGIGVILGCALLMGIHMVQSAAANVSIGSTTVTTVPQEFVMLSATTDSPGVFGEFVRNFPDGTTATQAFRVPSGKVLVVTDINVRTEGLTAAILLFYVQNLINFHTQFEVASIKLADASGEASTTQSFTTGFVVSEKAKIFVNFKNAQGTFSNGDIFIKGYLRPTP